MMKCLTGDNSVGRVYFAVLHCLLLLHGRFIIFRLGVLSIQLAG